MNIDEYVNIEELLIKGETIAISPKGFSMYPMLYPGKDTVIIGPVAENELKRGDVVLFRRDESILVLHRIHHINHEGIYLVGDNQMEIEGPIKARAIKGILKEFTHKGKPVKLSNPVYKLYSSVWLLLRPFRRVIGKSVHAIKNTGDRS